MLIITNINFFSGQTLKNGDCSTPSHLLPVLKCFKKNVLYFQDPNKHANNNCVRLAVAIHIRSKKTKEHGVENNICPVLSYFILYKTYFQAVPRSERLHSTSSF